MKPVNVEMQAAYIVTDSVDAGLREARSASVSVIRRAIQREEHKRVPRSDLVRGLKTELRRKEREAAAAPKERA